jgi:hypothetical protein
MANVEHIKSLANYLSSPLGSEYIDDGLRVLEWMKDSPRDETDIKGKEDGRDPKHDDCQYHHHDGFDRPLSVRTMVKTREL